MAEEYKRNPNTKCVICDKDIYRRPSQIENGDRQVYCSQTCFGISCRREIPCIVCGKMILAGANKKSCSRSCANKHRAGIKYNINRPGDKVKHQQDLKIRLLKYRGRNCERCNYSKYEILQVHHKDRNRKNNDMNNLELICPNCHCEEHYLEKSWLKNIFNEEKFLKL
jgi:hypothetical protein